MRTAFQLVLGSLLALTLVGAPPPALAQQGAPPEAEAEAPDDGDDPDEPVDAPVAAPPAAPPAPPPGPEERPAADGLREQVCDDRRDDDGDGMVDCSDADCFESSSCQIGGSSERSNAACTDWIDNDGDGYIDCDDDDCQRNDVSACQGSAPSASREAGAPAAPVPDEPLPELGEGETVEDLIGTHGDLDGERNDYLCSDGIDNDRDGRTDCADFGCRFDASVKICGGTPGLNFSVVAGIGFSYDLEEEDAAQAADVRFRRIQLRALGPIPYIQDSFFLLSMRMERSPRLTFAVFQVPLGDKGHYINVNSGSGSLTSQLIISASKRPLLDAPFYLLNAFEQGNGASLEFGGPLISSGRLKYRVFAAAGSGEFNGNVGGRFFRANNENFTWAAGAQLGIDFFGFYDRFDSSFLYQPASFKLATLIGLKYDQRARERYPAANVLGVFEYSHVGLKVESYAKYELEFGAIQAAWNVQGVVLLIPKWFVFAADVGGFHAGEFDEKPDFDGALQRPLDELQFRGALHLFWFRDVGLLSVLYAERHIEEDPDRPTDPTVEREIRAEVQFRF